MLPAGHRIYAVNIKNLYHFRIEQICIVIHLYEIKLSSSQPILYYAREVIDSIL